MGNILTLILKILSLGIIFVREVGHLRKQVPYFYEYKKPAFLDLEPEKKMSKEDYQIDMEKLFHKNQLFPRIRSEFLADPDFGILMDSKGIDKAFGFDLLVQMVLHKRVNLPTLVGILRKHFEGDCQATANGILLATESDLVDWDPQLQIFIMKWDITQDVKDDIDRYQYPLPMIVPPRPINNNTDTGYFTSRSSVILKNNHHEEDVCLDHLNKMNNIKLCINTFTAMMVKNKWKNLDKPKPGEDRKDYQKRVKAFEKFDRTARDVMVHLEMAENEFYLTHRYDKRGRTYCQGYHVNYQGTPWNKAVIEFVNEEVTK